MSFSHNLSVSDLRIFEAVARLGSMTRAAEELHTVQSNVTARVRVLEEQLATVLFDRTSRGVTLTAAGHRLLPYVRRLDMVLSDAARAVSDDGTPSGALVLGSLETTAAIRLPDVLTEYARAYPQVDLILKPGTTRELLEAVLKRDVEGAFVCGPVDHPEIEQRLAFREELAVMTSDAYRDIHAAFAEPSLKAIVLRSGCSYRQRLEDILTKRGALDVRWMEFGTLEAMISCVAAGIGLTLLPRGLSQAVMRGRSVKMHALPPEEAAVDTLFIRRVDAYESSALRAFVRCLAPVQPVSVLSGSSRAAGR